MNKSLKRIIGVFIFLTVLIAGIKQIPAKEPRTARVVRVACGMNDALYYNENGEPDGICLPYLRQLAWTNNWTLEYVEGSYNESIQNLYDGKVDLMFPVGPDEDYEGKMAFSEFIGGYQQIGLFAKDDADIFYDDYEGFNNTRVGLSIGSNNRILDEYASEHGFTYEAVSLNSTKDKIAALNNGDVDLIAFSTLNHVEGGKLVAVLDQVPVYFCTLASNEELTRELNEAMSSAMINAPDIVSAMYQNIIKGYNAISYTREENEKIQTTDSVVCGVYSDRLPLAGIDADGNCIGIYVDILKEISAQSGLNIEIYPIEDSNRLYSYLDDGTVDFVIGAQDLRFSQDNADNHLASNAITGYTAVAVSRSDYQFENDDNLVVALTADRTYLESSIKLSYPDAEVNYYQSRRECMNAVKKGNADITFLNTWEHNYETKNPRFKNMMEWENTRIDSVIGLGASRGSDLEILSILEKTVSLIPTEKISSIVSDNLNIPYQTYTAGDRIYAIKDQLIIATAISLVIILCFIIYAKVKRKYINQLVTANRAKSDFLSRMSHELRTPLNAIDGYAALTVQNVENNTISNEQLLKNMSSIKNASGYLLGIIQDILDVQRIETGRITLEKSYVSLKDFMHSAMDIFKPMAEEKKINFSYRMIKGGRYSILIDKLRVQQILFNVIFNAIKFTSPGGSVTINSDIDIIDDRKATIKLIVADTGIGMSSDFVANHLFHKFSQENQDITSPYSGCGNGLAICSELVKLMDGSISCESHQGKGTTFTIIINSEYTVQERRSREKKPQPDYDLSGIRVLICEDNPMNQDMERKVLECMRCEVDIADDGQIGLDKFMQSDIGYYNVVLMDIRMPNMDGLEATRQIRALRREDAAKVPILAVSANAFDEDVEKSLESGMNEHLAKPVGAELLYSKISLYCRK